MRARSEALWPQKEIGVIASFWVTDPNLILNSIGPSGLSEVSEQGWPQPNIHKFYIYLYLVAYIVSLIIVLLVLLSLSEFYIYIYCILYIMYMYVHIYV